jgi:hypothetical protein
VAWATIPSGDGTISACYGKQAGLVRIIDSGSAKCHKWESPISWSQTGPTGPKGTARAIHAALADEASIPTTYAWFLRLNLPKGYYALNGTAEVTNAQALGRVGATCTLYAPDGAMAFSSALSTVSNLALFGDSATLPLSGVAALAGQTNWIELRCYSNTGDPARTATIGERQLTAVQLDDIEFQDGTSGSGGN